MKKRDKEMPYVCVVVCCMDSLYNMVTQEHLQFLSQTTTLTYSSSFSLPSASHIIRCSIVEEQSRHFFMLVLFVQSFLSFITLIKHGITLMVQRAPLLLGNASAMVVIANVSSRTFALTRKQVSYKASHHLMRQPTSSMC